MSANVSRKKQRVGMHGSGFPWDLGVGEHPASGSLQGKGRQGKRHVKNKNWWEGHTRACTHARTRAHTHTHTHTHARTHARTVLSSMKSRSQTRRSLPSSWRASALLRKSRSRSSLSSSKRWSWSSRGRTAWTCSEVVQTGGRTLREGFLRNTFRSRKLAISGTNATVAHSEGR